MGRKAGVERWRRAVSGRAEGSAEAVEALAVVGEADQLPFEGDFGQTAQGEAPESEHFFDDAEDRFDGLLPEFVERTAGGGRGAVAALPRERRADITAERFCRVKVSGIVSRET